MTTNQFPYIVSPSVPYHISVHKPEIVKKNKELRTCTRRINKKQGKSLFHRHIKQTITCKHFSPFYFINKEVLPTMWWNITLCRIVQSTKLIQMSWIENLSPNQEVLSQGHGVLLSSTKKKNMLITTKWLPSLADGHVIVHEAYLLLICWQRLQKH